MDFKDVLMRGDEVKHLWRGLEGVRVKRLALPLFPVMLCQTLNWRLPSL